MLELLKVRINQGTQYIKDVRKAEVKMPFRGFPCLDTKKCLKNCKLCLDICPTGAITKPLTLDLGKCIFCGDCAKACPQGAIEFSNFHKLGVDQRKKLIIKSTLDKNDFYSSAIKANKKIKSIFGRSLKLRQVSAGGCSACEWELTACSNVNFDMGRFGIEFVASPRHADGIVITGPITKNMVRALEATYKSIPEPKLVILTGSCAISGGVFADTKELDRSFLKKNKIDLFIPGCPVHPLTFINGILSLLKK